MIDNSYNKVKKVWWYKIFVSLVLLKDKLSKEKYLKEIENFDKTPYLVDPSSFVLNDKMTPVDINNQNKVAFVSKNLLKDFEAIEKDFKSLKDSIENLKQTAKKILKKEILPGTGLLKKAISLRDGR